MKIKLKMCIQKTYNKYLLLVGSVSKMKGCNLYLNFGVEITLMKWYLSGYYTKLMKVNEHIGDHCNLVYLLWNPKASFIFLYFVPKEINQMFIVL
jgi:hypothetical protein